MTDAPVKEIKSQSDLETLLADSNSDPSIIIISYGLFAGYSA